MFTPGLNNPRRAAGMILLASALFAATTILAKYLGTHERPLHPFQIAAGRFFFAFLAISSFVLLKRPTLYRPNYPLHIGRSLCGWLGISLIFAAVAHIPVSDATAISFLNPIFGMMLAIPILGEKIGKWRWSAAGIALIGALILLRPGSGSFQAASILALCAAGIMGMEVTLIKLLSGREAPLQILFINNGIGALIACAVAGFFWVSPTWDQWIALGAIGFIMICGQALFIQAMRSAEASYVLPFSYATLVFATLYDFWFFTTRPDLVSILGASIILGGAALLAWREAHNR